MLLGQRPLKCCRASRVLERRGPCAEPLGDASALWDLKCRFCSDRWRAGGLPDGTWRRAATITPVLPRTRTRPVRQSERHRDQIDEFNDKRRRIGTQFIASAGRCAASRHRFDALNDPRCGYEDKRLHHESRITRSRADFGCSAQEFSVRAVAIEDRRDAKGRPSSTSCRRLHRSTAW